MLSSFLLVSQQVFVLFALMAVGFVCNRRKLLDENAVQGMVRVLVLVVTPCLIVHVFQRPFAPEMLAGLGEAFVVAFVAHALGVAAAFLLRTPDGSRRSVLRYAVIFSNAGFMGLPLQHAVLGDAGVFYGAVYVAVFNVVCWSYGLVVMAGSLRDLRLRSLILNPGTVGLAFALPFFLFSVRLPAVVGDPVRMLAALNTPLAMLVIGWYLARAEFSAVLGCGAAYGVAALRLLAVPLVLLGMLLALRPLLPAFDPTMAHAMIIASSAPVAALTTMLAASYRRDVQLSVGIVAGTTLLSALTMPVVVGLALTLFGTVS